jgi:hypothetical protein
VPDKVHSGLFENGANPGVAVREKQTHHKNTQGEADPTHRPPPNTREVHHSLLGGFYTSAKGKLVKKTRRRR